MKGLFYFLFFYDKISFQTNKRKNMFNKKNSKLALLAVTAATILVGCDVGSYMGSLNDEDVPVSTTPGVVKYKDGTLFGVTHSEPSDNGGYKIYSSSNGGVVGSIQRDGQVTKIDGTALGVCGGARLTDQGLQGECTLSIRNPSAPAPTTPTNNNTSSSTTITSGCSGGDASAMPGDCEDRRDGTFNASWSQSTCNQHGYFFCTISHSCTDQTININACLGK